MKSNKKEAILHAAHSELEEIARWSDEAQVTLTLTLTPTLTPTLTLTLTPTLTPILTPTLTPTLTATLTLTQPQDPNADEVAKFSTTAKYATIERQHGEQLVGRLGRLEEVHGLASPEFRVYSSLHTANRT